jgi:soluble lytic murein transglycosylase-like protein
MRVLPVTALCLAVVLAPAAAADAGTAIPTYIDHATWVSYGGLASLRVYPTGVGRQVARQLDKTAEQAEQAWLEVLAVAPDANTAAMRSQFVCHWNFAELAEPGKTSWNLEVWRPAVDDNTMVLSGCNPGGVEEAF